MDAFKDINTKTMKNLSLFILSLVILYGIYDARDSNTKNVFSSNVFNELPIYSVETDKKVVSITFDSAWGVEDLDEILAILDNHNCIATFFVTGDWASRYPEAIKKISEAGHIIGSHGMNHKHMTRLSEDDMIYEINNCNETVKSIINKDMDIFRAPYGDYNETVVKVANEQGYSVAQWDVDSLDWKDYGVESIIKTVCEHKNLKNGSIILLHNGSTYTKDALDQMLTNLEEQGYSYIALSDLILRDNYTIDHTGRQFSEQTINHN